MSHQTVLVLYTEDELIHIHILSRKVMQYDADMIGVLGQAHGVIVTAPVIVRGQRHIQSAMKEPVKPFFAVCAGLVVLTVQGTLQLLHTGLADTGFGYGERLFTLAIVPETAPCQQSIIAGGQVERHRVVLRRSRIYLFFTLPYQYTRFVEGIQVN